MRPTPCHAEMLIKGFNLESSKAVVTPGIKVAPNGEDADTMDDDNMAGKIQRIIAEISPKPVAPSLVKFNPEIKKFDVPAYSTVYGRHPC